MKNKVLDKLNDDELKMIKEYDHINEDRFSNHFIIGATKGVIGAISTYLIAGPVILESSAFKPVINLLTQAVTGPRAGSFLALGVSAIVGSIATYISYNSEKDKSEKLTQENSLLSPEDLIEKKLNVMKNITMIRENNEEKEKNSLSPGSKLLLMGMTI
jgi:hypothetical protein